MISGTGAACTEVLLCHDAGDGGCGTRRELLLLHGDGIAGGSGGPKGGDTDGGAAHVGRCVHFAGRRPM